jgi:hypothetical protein
VDGGVDQYPTGYPFLLRVLLGLGVGGRLSFHLLNLAFAGLAFVSFLLIALRLRGSLALALLIAILPFFSWVAVKHVTLPVSETTYLGVSAASLLFLFRSWLNRSPAHWSLLLLATALAVCATFVRTIGVSLVASCMAVVVLHPCHVPAIRAHLIRSRTKLLAAAVLVAVVVLMAGIVVARSEWYTNQFVLEDSYFQTQMRRFLSTGPVQFFVTNLRYRSSELGEFMANVPGSRAGVPLLFALLGAVGAILVALSIKRTWPLMAPLSIYAIFYLGILLLWPFYDPRFLLPIFPVLVIIAAEGLATVQLRPGAIGLLAVYCVAFVALGTLSIVFSTRISLSGRDFPNRYGDGSLKDSYLFAFGKENEADAKNVRQGVVHLLRRLEPLAREKHENDNLPSPGHGGS